MLNLESGLFHFVSSDHVGQMVFGQEVVQGLVSEHVASASPEVVDESGFVNPDVRWKTVFQLIRKRVVPEVLPNQGLFFLRITDVIGDPVKK